MLLLHEENMNKNNGVNIKLAVYTRLTKSKT